MDYKYICSIIIIFIIIYIVTKSINGCYEYYLSNDPMIQNILVKMRKLHPLVDKLKWFKGKKSYSINKKKVYLCLKDKDGKYYDENMLMYVAIHELAHCINTKDIGHTPAYYKVFNRLLDRAHKIGIFDKNKPLIQNYCNHQNHLDEDDKFQERDEDIGEDEDFNKKMEERYNEYECENC